MGRNPQARPSAPAHRVLERLSAGPADADELVRLSGRPLPEALALIGGLELEGILQREGHGRYVLSSRDRHPSGRRLERFPS